ncbi:MAG: hypothetical protein ACRDVP_06190 [Acidimicrobiales bacterium]
MQVIGSRLKSALGWTGIAGIVILGGALLASDFRTTGLAYDDVNP